MSASSPERPQGGRFVLTTLGCKVNQAEAASLAAQLEAQGWRPASEGQPADLVVLLTCSVTATAGRQSRQMARRLARAQAGARIVVSGCDAQAAPLAYRREGLEVAGRASLAGLAGMLGQGLPLDSPPQLPAPDAGPFCLGLRAPLTGRTRGLLKVQDGCDAACAYCIVPSTRGGPRSLPLAQAAQLWQELGQAGAAEVVLTGVHLGRYGQDLEPPLDLARLLEALLAAHPGPRLRLSSLEVSELSPGVLDLLAREPRLCPHLHVPLQTGSARLLKAVGRPYTPQEYAQRLRQVAQALPGLCLGADVMVGLPGESEQDFADTEALIASLPLSYLHVFPYSPRPGTPAAAWPGRVPGPLARQRAARLRELGRAKWREFLASQQGQTAQVVVEASGLGRAANYCLVRLPAQAPAGSLLAVRLGRLEDSPEGPLLAGEPLGQAPGAFD